MKSWLRRIRIRGRALLQSSTGGPLFESSFATETAAALTCDMLTPPPFIPLAMFVLYPLNVLRERPQTPCRRAARVLQGWGRNSIFTRAAPLGRRDLPGRLWRDEREVPMPILRVPEHRPHQPVLRPPDCPQCAALMRFVCIVPHQRFSNLDERRFACDCGETFIDVVARSD